MPDETLFLKDVARRLQAISDAKRLQPQIEGALKQLAELERLIAERGGLTAPGAHEPMCEAAEANARLQQYVAARTAAERVIRETAYCLPMLTYQGGEIDGVGS